ncbi:MAG: hypothetical protein ACRCT8_12305 [Lacipirellulaceae bacterium]
MIHFTCDACRRSIEPQDELRYVVRVEVYAALDDERPIDADADHLQDIDDLIARSDDSDQDDDLYQQVRYDLCAECRVRFLQNPLGRGGAVKLGFSNN